MIQIVTVLGFIIFAYLLGSVSSAIIVSKISGLGDPRTEGSGNPGATNMLRLGGKKLALLVLLGDLLKGVIVIVLAKYFLPAQVVAWTGVAVVLGHIFPVFFKFKGGKGVATGGGVMVGLLWYLGLMIIFVWLLTAVISRYSSLGAIVAIIATPILTAWFVPQYLFPVIIINLLILWRHHDNMLRLIKGTEAKIGQR